jgi:hypothetical protein
MELWPQHHDASGKASNNHFGYFILILSPKASARSNSGQRLKP